MGRARSFKIHFFKSGRGEATIRNVFAESHHPAISLSLSLSSSPSENKNPSREN